MKTSQLQWCLVGQTSTTGEPSRIVIKDVLTVGRLTECNLCIPRRIISAKHAKVYLRDGRMYAQDLGSTNGTYVNGRQVVEEVLVNAGDLVQFADEVFRADCSVPSRDSVTIQQNTADAALAAVQFDKLINEPAVVPFFQPIVEVRDLTILGYEVLGRSRLVGLSSPDLMFETAAKFCMEAELSRMFRAAGVEKGMRLKNAPVLFLNTHPVELRDLASLERSLRAIRETAPEMAIALEIHEAAVTSAESTRRVQSLLSELRIELAYDDFGSGQARLREIAEEPPTYIKFDMSLIRNIQLASPSKQNLLERLVQMSIELGVRPLAEGVETKEEHDVCVDMGFQLGQGFLYGRPAAVQAFTSEGGVHVSLGAGSLASR